MTNLNSSSLNLGRSLIPANCKNVSRFATGAVNAMKDHPELAAEICIAATEKIISDPEALSGGIEQLRTSMNVLFNCLCSELDRNSHA